MKITNKLNLPEVFLSACEKDDREIVKDRYSVTELLRSPQEIILRRENYNLLTRDIVDNIPMLFGIAVHEFLEKHAPRNVKTEVKLELDIYGKTLVGICDSLDLENKILVDYKTTSVSKVTRNDFDDYYKQGMMYALMIYHKYDVKIKKITNYLLLKDWSKIKSVMSNNYPNAPIYVWEYEVKDSDFDNITDFIKKKFAELDSGIRDCTDKERWYTGDKYAVYKNKGDKRARRVFDNLPEAEQYQAENDFEFIEKRTGDDLKCNYYCDVREFCKQKRKGEL